MAAVDPVANGTIVDHHDRMFDWSDLLLLLPDRVLLALLAVFLLMVMLLVIWSKYA